MYQLLVEVYAHSSVAVPALGHEYRTPGGCWEISSYWQARI